MGLVSKIQNASSVVDAVSSYGSHGSYDYPQPQQHTGSYNGGSYSRPQYCGGGSYDGGYGAQLPRPQYYSSGYTAPHEHPVHQHRPPSSYVESTPYNGVLRPNLYVYGEQVQTPRPYYMQPATSMLAQKLQAIIQANGLQPFYADQGRFQATLQKVASINFAQVAAQWKISKELAYDLSPLALYNIVFYCDDSGSMAFEEDGDRIDDLKFILSKVSAIASKFDDDGITVRFMNSNVNGDGIRSATDVENLISRVRFNGMTPLGTNFDRKVIQPFVLGQARSSNMAKPVLAIVITDGEPAGEARSTICQVIRHAKEALMRTWYGGGAFAVQIAQVGKDAKAQRFLESLDKDPVVGGMIDCTSYYEMEEEECARNRVTLTPELWVLKMCLGAIDREYDSKDFK